SFSLYLRHLHSFPTRRSSDLAAPFTSRNCTVTMVRSPSVLKIFLVLMMVNEFKFSGSTTESKVKRLVTRSPFGLLMVPLMKKPLDRKSTRLNSSHVKISYAVF